MTAAEIVMLVVKISIILLVLSIGLRSKPEDILSLIRQPGLLARAFLSMNIIMPLFAIAAIKLFHLRIELAVALLALSVSPVPPLLPRRAEEAKGEYSFVIGLLAVFAVLSILWIPLAAHFVGILFGRGESVSPGRIALVAAMLVIAPLLAGIALRRLAADFAKRIEHAVGLVAVVGLVLAGVLIVVKTAPAMLGQIGDGTILVLAAFVVVGLLAGHLLGGPVPQERTDLALATASRHPGIALATAQLAFPDMHAVSALVGMYLIVGLVIGLPYIKWRARRMAAPDGKV